MATKPIDGGGNTLYPEWATTDWAELKDVEGNGVLVLLNNKTEPTPEWKDSGNLFQQNLPYDYVNFQFDLLDRWVKYFNEGVVGDYKVMASTETATSVAERFGGTWSDLGTDTLAGETIRLFKKTA